MGSLQKVILFF